MLRYRVVSQEAMNDAQERALAQGRSPVASGTTTTSGTSSSSTARPTPTQASAVRVRVRSVSVTAHDAGGSSWDIMGGAPDPYVVVTSIPQGRELARTPAVDDNREARFDLWLPATLRREDFPLRFAVYDEDVAGDEVVGSADLEASQIPATESSITLDVRSQGETPRQTGVLRLTLQPAH